MLIGGQKWACQSCIRGHRASICTHADRDLFPIAPKGRPVKRCEHCPSARNGESHHAKCNHRNKKHKDMSSESGPKKPSNKRISGLKSERSDVRIQEALLPIKSRPTLGTRVSKNILTTGHPKLQHHNTLGHTSSQPYTKPKRPASLHNPSYNNASNYDLNEAEPRAMDDLHLFNSDHGRIYDMSTDNLSGFPSATFDANYDFGKCFSNDLTATEASQLFRTTSADTLSAQSTWYDNPLGTMAENPGDIPSAASDFFSTSDHILPKHVPEETIDLVCSTAEDDLAPAHLLPTRPIDQIAEADLISVSGV